MHPLHHAATMQYGQPQPQRQTYIHSVGYQTLNGQAYAAPQASQAQAPQVQGQAQFTFYAANGVAAPAFGAGSAAHILPPSGPPGRLMQMPMMATPHPLPPEHSITLASNIAAPHPAGPPDPAEDAESSSEYESDSDAEPGQSAQPPQTSGSQGVAQTTDESHCSGGTDFAPSPENAGAGEVSVSEQELAPASVVGPPSMTITSAPSLHSDAELTKESFNVNYQTHDVRELKKEEDQNYQTKIDPKINEALILPTRSRKVVATDEHLDQLLFPRGYHVDRELPPKRKGLPAGALGKGAFGVVYKGRKRDGKDVALKVSENASATQPMLEQEINILKMLDHPSIVQFYDAFVDKDSDWMIIAMELVTGGDLLSSLTGEPHVYEEGLVRPMVFHISCALAHAHEMGVVHRDLKPENILLRQGDRFPKVADFGLSRSLRASEVAMTVAGTPTYMAPEIQDPRLPYDFPADVYSLGCILTDMMDKEFCCSWYAKAMPGNHEKMRKRWPDGSTPHRFSRELKELQGRMLGQAPGLRASCFQICKDLLCLADEQVLPNVLWQERPKLPSGPPQQKMLSPEMAADIAGRRGYGVGVRVLVLVNGQWLHGKVERVSSTVCPGAVQVHFKCDGEEQATLICPWQFQEMLRPAPAAVVPDGRIGTMVFPEADESGKSRKKEAASGSPSKRSGGLKEAPLAKMKCQPTNCRQQ
ncbi:unnamed protein product [Durusdinium trenchii]|uniref:non-specific serine/threonine protein kinase n=1 Tax=Durusdinium trenchii TaxID=1381693 RepID=A0ABP0M4N8_9DINO